MKPGVVVDDIPNGVGVTVEVGEVAMEQSTGLRIFRFLQPAVASQVKAELAHTDIVIASEISPHGTETLPSPT